MTINELLDEFRHQCALERRWMDIQGEQRPFELQQYLWWDWYYYDQWNWRSMAKKEATIVWPAAREKLVKTRKAPASLSAQTNSR